MNGLQHKRRDVTVLCSASAYVANSEGQYYKHLECGNRTTSLGNMVHLPLTTYEWLRHDLGLKKSNVAGCIFKTYFRKPWIWSPEAPHDCWHWLDLSTSSRCLVALCLLPLALKLDHPLLSANPTCVWGNKTVCQLTLCLLPSSEKGWDGIKKPHTLAYSALVIRITLESQRCGSLVLAIGWIKHLSLRRPPPIGLDFVLSSQRMRWEKRPQIFAYSSVTHKPNHTHSIYKGRPFARVKYLKSKCLEIILNWISMQILFNFLLWHLTWIFYITERQLYQALICLSFDFAFFHFWYQYFMFTQENNNR